MKRSPSHTSEQTSQLIFGECYKILKTNDEWVLVHSSHDYYEGWILRTQLKEIAVGDYEYLNRNHWERCSELLGKSYQNGYVYHPIPLGARLVDWGGFSYKCKRTVASKIHHKRHFLLRCARKFLNAPYQWGGRSVFGIDCAGLTQLCFAMLGIYLPRNSKDQSQKGRKIDFEQADRGDLAFFGSPKSINHVGILLAHNKIIHCSGQVRIDKINAKGIFKDGIQTHKLVALKRLLD